jgi:hypothetical protein
MIGKFYHLKIGLGVVLSFVGTKMILSHTRWEITTHVALGVIVAILAASIIWSLLKPKRLRIRDGGRSAPLRGNWREDGVRTPAKTHAQNHGRLAA